MSHLRKRKHLIIIFVLRFVQTARARARVFQQMWTVPRTQAQGPVVWSHLYSSLRSSTHFTRLVYVFMMTMISHERNDWPSGAPMQVMDKFTHSPEHELDWEKRYDDTSLRKHGNGRIKVVNCSINLSRLHNIHFPDVKKVDKRLLCQMQTSDNVPIG
jgi:hypothetical protein